MREAHRMRRESTATRETPAGSARKPRRPGPAHLDSRRACRTCPAVMGLIAFGAAGKLLAADIDTSRLPPPASVQIEFTRDIKPILADHCYKCHSGEQPRSHFLLTSRESALIIRGIITFIIRCCAGSMPACGVMRCVTKLLITIRIGNM